MISRYEQEQMTEHLRLNAPELYEKLVGKRLREEAEEEARYISAQANGKINRRKKRK